MGASACWLLDAVPVDRITAFHSASQPDNLQHHWRMLPPIRQVF